MTFWNKSENSPKLSPVIAEYDLSGDFGSTDKDQNIHGDLEENVAVTVEPKPFRPMENSEVSGESSYLNITSPLSDLSNNSDSSNDDFSAIDREADLELDRIIDDVIQTAFPVVTSTGDSNGNQNGFEIANDDVGETARDDSPGKRNSSFVSTVAPSVRDGKHRRRWRRTCTQILTNNLIPDEWCYLLSPRYRIIQSPQALRILKFVSITIWTILVWYRIVRAVNWEHDVSYSLGDFASFDLGSVVLDCTMFALVGRIYERRGVDRLLPTLLPMLGSCLYGSWSSELWFLRNSITMYNMVCTWPWQLWMYASVLGVGIVTIFGLHIRASVRDGSFLYRLLEMTMIIGVFLLPGIWMNHDSFHLHHYYSFWLLGMFFNRDEWWSQFAMAVAWGQYINGISCWGRDSILTCAFSEYVAIGNGGCGGSRACACDTIMNEGLNMTSNSNVVNRFLEESITTAMRDWRNCNAS